MDVTPSLTVVMVVSAKAEEESAEGVVGAVSDVPAPVAGSVAVAGSALGKDCSGPEAFRAGLPGRSWMEPAVRFRPGGTRRDPDGAAAPAGAAGIEARPPVGRAIPEGFAWMAPTPAEALVKTKDRLGTASEGDVGLSAASPGVSAEIVVKEPIAAAAVDVEGSTTTPTPVALLGIPEAAISEPIGVKEPAAAAAVDGSAAEEMAPSDAPAVADASAPVAADVSPTIGVNEPMICAASDVVSSGA